jgi:hypothetical protein
VTSAQIEKSILAMQKRIVDLEGVASRVTTLEGQVKSLLQKLGRKCHFCPEQATQQIRIFLGAVKYAQDILVCDKCAAAQKAAA